MLGVPFQSSPGKAPEVSEPIASPMQTGSEEHASCLVNILWSVTPWDLATRTPVSKGEGQMENALKIAPGFLSVDFKKGIYKKCSF